MTGDITRGEAFALGAAGGSGVLALFAFCCWAGSRLLDHLEDRVYREQEKQK